jgi:hypothetical protein
MFRSQYKRNYRLPRRPCDEIATPPACSRTGQLNEQASKIIELLAVSPARHHKVNFGDLHHILLSTKEDAARHAQLGSFLTLARFHKDGIGDD